MHDLNLLPETETVKRRSRLVALAAIGLTAASAVWVGGTQLSNQQLKTELRRSIELTESEITPVPDLNRRIQDHATTLAGREETLAHLTTLPRETTGVAAALEAALTAFAADDQPDITLDRITAQRAPGDRLAVTVKGRALTGAPIQARFERLNAQGLLVASPVVKAEADGTYAFDGDLELPLAQTTAAVRP